MNLSRSYKGALIAAIALHCSLVMVLLMDPTSHATPVLALTDNPEKIQSEAAQNAPSQPDPIKAVSVDSAEVMKTMNRLKSERAQQQQAEKTRQRNLEKQVELARKERIQEQQRVQNLKNEAEKIAIAHKKQLEDEKKRLENVAKLKVEEEKRLANVKQQQKQEANKLALLKKKQDDAKKESTLADAKRLAEEKRQKDARVQAEQERQHQLSVQHAAADAERTARIAGEVDRYKALIISAISRQWILPENAQSSLSSQFRIRLAPDGSVLEVTLTRGSGDSVLDHSAQSAIYKASPLPVPMDPEAFNTFRDISLTVRPDNARG